MKLYKVKTDFATETPKIMEWEIHTEEVTIKDINFISWHGNIKLEECGELIALYIIDIDHQASNPRLKDIINDLRYKVKLKDYIEKL